MASLFGNGSNIVPWQPSPNNRGTFDILSSCLITLFLCVWTAVHMNISPPGHVWGPRFRKVGWLVLALLAPEMVAYTAWWQRQRARAFMKIYNKTLGLSNPIPWHSTAATKVKSFLTRRVRKTGLERESPSKQENVEMQETDHQSERYPWTMTHGFYACMGGLAIHISDRLPKAHRFPPPGSDEHWFVTHWGLMTLLCIDEARDELRHLSEKEIKSKSKANGLAKSLVCLQALWFIAQCLTRLAQHISITLLELNTFGHAVCALLIYLLWWEKPFDVDYPTILQSQDLLNMAALRWMESRQSAAGKKIMHDYLEQLERSPNYPKLKKREKCNRQESEISLFQVLDGNEEPAGQYQDHLAPNQVFPGTGFQAREHVFSRLDPQPPLVPQPAIRLTDEDNTRLRMAWHASQISKTKLLDEMSYHMWFDMAFNERVGDIPDFRKFRPAAAFGFCGAAFIYGGLHALAWSAHFRSPTESILWRISACTVMAGLIVYFAYEMMDFSHIYVPLLDRLSWVLQNKGWERRADFSWNNFLRPWVRVNLVLVLYVLARAYLVVECFISLSHLPADAYQVPNWSAYFPHFS